MIPEVARTSNLLQSKDAPDREDLSFMQQRVLSLAEDIAENENGEIFATYVNFIRHNERSKVRIHNTDSLIQHIEALTYQNQYQKMSECIVIGPIRRTVIQIVDRIAGLPEPTTIRLVYPENQDDMMFRTTAIASLIDRIPPDCLRFVQGIIIRKRQSEHMEAITCLEITIGNQMNERIHIPVQARPTALVYLRKEASPEIREAINELLPYEQDVA